MSVAYKYVCDTITNRIVTPCKVNRPFVPNETDEEVDALWDTGATCTCISESLAQKLGLAHDDETTLTVGDNRVVDSRVYSVQIMLGDFIIPYIRVSSLPGSDTHDVIIGMDVISNGDLSISNYKGKTVITFREPSIARIDYVDELAKYTKIHDIWLKQGNNQCPCKSGRTWERCHGKERL